MRLRKTGSRFLPGLLLAVALFLGGGVVAEGVTFDWSTITWNDGDLMNSYDIDPSHPGNDITITITGDTGGFLSPSPNVYPIGNTFAFTGGISTDATAASQNLDLFVNHGSNLDSTTVTVALLYATGVTNVEYTLFDIDSAATTGGGGALNYRDEIRSISAFNSITTTTIYDPTVTIANSSFVEQTGSGPSLAVLALNSTTANATDNTNEGNANFDWGSNVLTEFTFEYGNGPNSETNPAQQGVGFHNFTFTVAPVPEPAAAFLLLMGGALWLRRRVGSAGCAGDPFLIPPPP